MRRFITRAKPWCILCFSTLCFTLCFSTVFAAVVICILVPADVMYKKSHCRHISVVFTSIFTIQTSKSLKYSKRTKIRLVLSHSGAVNRKNSVPFDPENLRKFTPEYLIERKTPKGKIQLFPYVVAFMSSCCYYVFK